MRSWDSQYIGNGDEKLSKRVYASRSPYVVGGRLYLFCCLAGQGRRFPGRKTEKIEFLLDCEHRVGSSNRSLKDVPPSSLKGPRCAVQYLNQGNSLCFLSKASFFSKKIADAFPKRNSCRRYVALSALPPRIAHKLCVLGPRLRVNPQKTSCRDTQTLFFASGSFNPLFLSLSPPYLTTQTFFFFSLLIYTFLVGL